MARSTTRTTRTAKATPKAVDVSGFTLPQTLRALIDNPGATGPQERLAFMAERSSSPKWARALAAVEAKDEVRIAYYAADTSTEEGRKAREEALAAITASRPKPEPKARKTQAKASAKAPAKAAATKAPTGLSAKAQAALERVTVEAGVTAAGEAAGLKGKALEGFVARFMKAQGF